MQHPKPQTRRVQTARRQVRPGEEVDPAIVSSAVTEST
jgi:hypothetical protein